MNLQQLRELAVEAQGQDQSNPNAAKHEMLGYVAELEAALAKLNNWQVTYFNEVLRRRCVMVDFVDEQTADAVMAKFGNPHDTRYYMNDAKKELMA